MFSEELVTYAKNAYQKRADLLQPILPEIEKKMEDLTEDERLCMELFYGTMPLSDAGEYDFDVLLGFTRHGLFLRREVSWCRTLPERIFVEHVLYYRINSESICDCRRFFFEKIYPRVEKLSCKEAVLETNYWCAENMTYESSDDRTESPMTAYFSGKGRCGEESVFAVTALRSIGIPARQVYVPFWSHCNDNHAWVEVWVAGAWHFLGACEPEEVLDRGWFLSASSRAMLVYARSFLPFASPRPKVIDWKKMNAEEGAQEAFDQTDDLSEEEAGRDGILTFYNRTTAYAPARKVQIHVLTSLGKAAANASVEIQILNYGSLQTVTTLATDKEGITSITLGLGDFHVHAIWQDETGERFVFGKEREPYIFLSRKTAFSRDSLTPFSSEKFPDKELLKNELNTKSWKSSGFPVSFPAMSTVSQGDNIHMEENIAESTEELLITAPKVSLIHKGKVTEEQKALTRKRQRQASALREQRIASYYSTLPAKDPILQNESVKRLLHRAGKNAETLFAFLRKFSDAWSDTETVAESDMISLPLQFLLRLSDKDLKDVSMEVLEDHFGAVTSDTDFALRYLWNPRIDTEELTPYRSFLRSFFSIEEQEAFGKAPENIWTYIDTKICEYPEENYDTLCSTPRGCLSLKQGSKNSKRILFVAMCRTFGIPSRLSPQDGTPQYWNGAAFVPPFTLDKMQEAFSHKVNLHIGFIKAKESDTLEYGTNLTLAYWKKDHYQTLKALPSSETNLFSVSLSPGCYRLIHVKRRSDGSQHMEMHSFFLKAREEKVITLKDWKADEKELLVHFPLPDFQVYLPGDIIPEKETFEDGTFKRGPSGKGTLGKVPSHSISSIRELTKGDPCLIFFLEEGKEPTEHVLNELLEKRERLLTREYKILFLVGSGESLKNPAMQRVLSQIPGILTGIDPELGNAEQTARSMYLDPEKLPLALAVKEDLIGIVGFAGYHVGSVDLLCRLLAFS